MGLMRDLTGRQIRDQLKTSTSSVSITNPILVINATPGVPVTFHLDNTIGVTLVADSVTIKTQDDAENKTVIGNLAATEQSIFDAPSTVNADIYVLQYNNPAGNGSATINQAEVVGGVTLVLPGYVLADGQSSTPIFYRFPVSAGDSYEAWGNTTTTYSLRWVRRPFNP